MNNKGAKHVVYAECMFGGKEQVLQDSWRNTIEP